MTPIKVLSGALDELTEGQIVLRGVIDPASFRGLLKPDYQRETLRESTIEGFDEGVPRWQPGACPMWSSPSAVNATDAPTPLGRTPSPAMCTSSMASSGSVRPDSLCLDGGKPLVGAMLHFGTTEEWERERFDILNMRRTKLSPNVLLRNRAAQCPSLRRLHDLCTDESFVLGQRVSWSQYMRREELLTALSFLKTVMRLHSKFGAGRYHSVSGLWQALPPMMASVGHTTMIENVKTFFELLDGTWGIRGILYKDRATHLKHGFLFALADVISAHPAFWSGKSLRIDRDMQKKIGQFGLSDPSVRVMACSGSSVGLLNRLIVDHINSGRRTRRLAAPEPYQGGTRREA